VKYDVVQQSLEDFVTANWTETEVQYDNVAFNAELYREYLQCTIRFGPAAQRTLVREGCYRQIGLLILTAKVKPGTGTSRKLSLAATAAAMITNVVVHPTGPLVAPNVVLKVPDLFTDEKERDGWVMAQVSCPFYYDFTEI